MSPRLQRLFSLLPDEQPQDKVLIIDGLNTLIRCHAMSTDSDESGNLVGSITQFIYSIGYAIKTVSPQRVIVCFDGKFGNTKRKEIFPEYKANRDTAKVINKLMETREQEQELIVQQVIRLINLLNCLPVQMIQTDYVEADDIIAHLALKTFKNELVVIMSSDKDYYQLINERITVYSPVKKLIYDIDRIKEEYQINNIKNFIYYKSILGDAGDNIPKVKGSGHKTLQKDIPLLFEDKEINFQMIYDYIETLNKKSKLQQTILESKELLDLSFKLGQLFEPLINKNEIIILENAINNKINRLNSIMFVKMLIEEGISSAFKFPKDYLKEVYQSIDIKAQIFNDKLNGK